MLCREPSSCEMDRIGPLFTEAQGIFGHSCSEQPISWPNLGTSLWAVSRELPYSPNRSGSATGHTSDNQSSDIGTGQQAFLDLKHLRQRIARHIRPISIRSTSEDSLSAGTWRRDISFTKFQWLWVAVAYPSLGMFHATLCANHAALFDSVFPHQA